MREGATTNRDEWKARSKNVDRTTYGGEEETNVACLRWGESGTEKDNGERRGID